MYIGLQELLSSRKSHYNSIQSKLSTITIQIGNNKICLLWQTVADYASDEYDTSTQEEFAWCTGTTKTVRSNVSRRGFSSESCEKGGVAANEWRSGETPCQPFVVPCQSGCQGELFTSVISQPTINHRSFSYHKYRLVHYPFFRSTVQHFFQKYLFRYVHSISLNGKDGF